MSTSADVAPRAIAVLGQLPREVIRISSVDRSSTTPGDAKPTARTRTRPECESSGRLVCGASSTCGDRVADLEHARSGSSAIPRSRTTRSVRACTSPTRRTHAVPSPPELAGHGRTTMLRPNAGMARPTFAGTPAGGGVGADCLAAVDIGVWVVDWLFDQHSRTPAAVSCCSPQ